LKLPLKSDLTGKTAVITGGGGVLCSEFAYALAAYGANVAVCDLRLDSASKVADKIKADGGNALAVKMDVLDKPGLIEAKSIIDNAFGGCDILLNGAGGNHPKGTTTKEYLFPEDLEEDSESLKDLKDIVTFFDLDPEGIKFVFDLNFIGTLLPTQVFAADMAKRKDPVIINISSMNSFRPLTKIPAYSGAKAAVSNLTMWLAVHFAPVGIRVNAIAPGFFVTNQNRALLMNPDGSLTPRSEKILAHTPQKRFGEPSDLIGTLIWLCDAEASGFVDGVVIPVDGGFAAYSGV
jgi:NAD(P)-dependent dehydrogenase (short-subunit alcohol dehydrogenase family)